jgi:hypothetical protein
MQRRTQAAVDQRRFARTRRADDDQEMRVRKGVDHAVDLVLAAEEKMLLILTERT